MTIPIIAQEKFIDLLEEAKWHEIRDAFNFGSFSVFASTALWNKYIYFKDEYSDRFSGLEIKYSLNNLLTALEVALKDSKPDEVIISFTINEIPRDADALRLETVQLKAIKTFDQDANLIIKVTLLSETGE